jgi:hypothetical protein
MMLAAAVLLAFGAFVQGAEKKGGAKGNPTGPKGSSFAENHPRRNEVNERVANQRSRVNQGEKNGKLTPGQAKQLEANDKAIKQQEHRDVKANGGHLTKPEQKQLNQEENANSKLIRDEKNPASGSSFAEKHPRRAEVNERVANQKSRINQGEKSGKLTPGQAKQLEANDKAIKQQEHRDVKANGGHLTKPEQKQLNQEENANSKLIHDEKNPVP